MSNHVEANETVGKASALVSFPDALQALKEGKRVRREYWDIDDCFIFRQVPSKVGWETIPKMTSLPQSVKDEFDRRFDETEIVKGDLDIKYQNQVAVVFSDNSIESWAPSVSDIFAEDWVILD